LAKAGGGAKTLARKMDKAIAMAVCADRPKIKKLNPEIIFREIINQIP